MPRSIPPAARRLTHGGRTLGWLIVAATGLALSGCWNLSTPRLFNPGPVEYQRRQAHQFDPYPDDMVGPKNDGPRPRDFLKPPPDTVRARWLSQPPGQAPPALP